MTGTAFRIAAGFTLAAMACPALADPAGPPAPSANAADRGVYISQIGDANRATVRQSAPIATARVSQDGDRNVAVIDQRGAASAFADIRQTGLLNDAAADQSGTSGSNAVLITQSGTGNMARAVQSATGAEGNAAMLAQNGNDNVIALVQDGADNIAQLDQQGDGNTMTASQTGTGGRLNWTQQGSNLSNLAIAQTGAQTLHVTQSR